MSWDRSQIPWFEGNQIITRNQFHLVLQLRLFKYASLILEKPGHSFLSLLDPEVGQVRQTETFSDANRTHKNSKITGEEKSKQLSSWKNSSFSQRKAVTGMRLFKGKAAKSWDRTMETILCRSEWAFSEGYLQIQILEGLLLAEIQIVKVKFCFSDACRLFSIHLPSSNCYSSLEAPGFKKKVAYIPLFARWMYAYA